MTVVGAEIPDFDVYPAGPTVAAATAADRWVEVTWADGSHARFHHVWLRDNCPCSTCVHPITKEQLFELVAGIAPVPASATAPAGDLEIEWTGDGHRSRYHPGWLRAHAYDGVGAAAAARPTTWDAATPGIPPTFDGTAVLADDDELDRWLAALADVGLARLTGVPPDPDAVGRVASRIGPIRETNFGVLWDVRAEVAPVSNANTTAALPPHVDLPTREYQPGLQFLHCLRNSAPGGLGRYVDGFRVAEVLADERPDQYAVLTTVAWPWVNRAVDTDHRWSTPPIVLDRAGAVVEVRLVNWLRGPLAVDFDRVEEVYAAAAAMTAVARRDDLAIALELRPGDLVAFDNRRVLHGRDSFGDGGGERWLRGCYSERDELRSRRRILDRARRAVMEQAP